MKLSSIKIDSVRFEQGAWVGESHGTPIPNMGDLALKVRGINNKDWRRLQTQLIEALPRSKRVAGRVDTDAMDGITTTCLLNACLLDWAGLLDDNDQTLEYSKAAAEKLLLDPDMMQFRDAIAWAASRVADIEEADRRDVVGN